MHFLRLTPHTIIPIKFTQKKEKKMRMGKLRSGIAWLMIICGIEAAAAAVFTVGDTSGWSIGSDYSTWASDKTFSIGDTIVFTYPPGHTVDEVSASDYKTCTVGNAIASDSSGSTSVSLKTAGPHYYICGVPGHCGGGMKLSITVSAAAAGGGGGVVVPGSTTVSTAPPAAVTALPPPASIAVPAGGGFTDPYASSARLSAAAAAVLAFYGLAIFMCFV